MWGVASRDKRNTSSVEEPKRGGEAVGKGRRGEGVGATTAKLTQRILILFSKVKSEDDHILMHFLRGNFRSVFF